MAAAALGLLPVGEQGNNRGKIGGGDSVAPRPTAAESRTFVFSKMAAGTTS